MRPDRARRFAESLGPLVKADYEDAKVLARYGRLEGLEASAPLHLALAQLQDLAPVARQRKLSGNPLTRCYRLWSPVVPQGGQHAWTADVDPTRLPNRGQRNEKTAPGSSARPSH